MGLDEKVSVTEQRQGASEYAARDGRVDDRPDGAATGKCSKSARRKEHREQSKREAQLVVCERGRQRQREERERGEHDSVARTELLDDFRDSKHTANESKARGRVGAEAARKVNGADADPRRR